MKKLKLQLERLRVESFRTAVPDTGRGTVRAMSETDYIQVCDPGYSGGGDNTCRPFFTCDATGTQCMC